MKYLTPIVIIGLSLLLLIFGCKKESVNSDNDGSDTTFVAFEEVDDYGYFAVTEKGTAIIKNEKEWLNLWDLYWNVYDDIGNKTPPPEINFNEKMVIGIFWGNECTYSGCTNESPSIQSVFITMDTLYINIGELVDLGICGMCVQPLHLIEIDMQNLPTRFIGSVP